MFVISLYAGKSRIMNEYSFIIRICLRISSFHFSVFVVCE